MDQNFGKKTGFSPSTFLKIFSIVVFLGFVKYSKIFVAGTSSMTIRKDYWRHYDRILIPIQENLENWKLLWANHHHNPGLHIHQLINEKFFAQNLLLDDWWMFALQAFMALLLVGLFLRRVNFDQYPSAHSNFRPLLAVGLTIYIVIAIHLGAREIGFYSAPLESLQNYSHLLALLLIAVISRSSKNIRRSRIIVIFFLTLLLLFSHFSYAIIYIAAIFLTWIAIAISNREKKLLGLSLIPVFAAILYSAVLFLIILDPQKGTGQSGMLSRIFALLPQIFDTTWTFGNVTTNALIGKISTDFSIGTSLIICANLLIITISILIGIFGGRHYSIGTPLIMFGMLFALATLVAREHSTILAPRISGNFEIMWAGCVLNIGVFLVQPKSGNIAEKAMSSFLLLWLAIAAILLSVYAHKQLKLVKATKSQIASTELALFMTSLPENKMLDIVRPKNKDVLAYLQKNKLNVFSEQGQSLQGIHRHMRAREICANPSKDNMDLFGKTFTIDQITAVVPEPQCVTLMDNKGARALKIETLANKYDVAALHVKEDDNPNSKFTVAKGTQIFYIPVDPNTTINLCVRKPLKTVSVSFCN